MSILNGKWDSLFLNGHPVAKGLLCAMIGQVAINAVCIYDTCGQCPLNSEVSETWFVN